MTGSSTEHEEGDASHVVTAFLRNRGEVLLLCRSDAVGTYAGQWGGVSGFAEDDPDEQVRVEIVEETGLEDRVSLVRSGRELEVIDDELEREWVVHPYLFECESRAVELSEEHDAFEWVSPTVAIDLADGSVPTSSASVAAAAEIPGIDDRETVPGLWEAYERVAPSVRSVAADDEHGAAFLSVRALEVLRDRAGLLVGERADAGVDPEAEWGELAGLAGRLLEARPSMAVLRNRVNRAMANASAGDDAEAEGSAGDRTATAAPSVPGALELLESAVTGIDRSVDVDQTAAETAAEHFGGDERVLTLSRSGTVLAALEAWAPARVFVAESRPAREGVDVAEKLAGEIPVTIHTDAAAAAVLSREAVDRVVVGADTIRPDGAVVNKTGTRSIALTAAREGIPFSVIAAADKVSTRSDVNLESGSRAAVYDGEASIDVLNPTFDVTPADCVDEYVTERGPLERADIDSIAAELRELGAWNES
ncbi:initiation factor 2B [Halostagnicola kamekurae]|uniref:Translation initiation factor 2B subunit, eIF-2B alpha/beta/delta family n=1 Tax=Halostagnicola kamekurae TaxID=619731 RepID=A0A1I6RHA5_9EURY|nr:initiation factor 2B [Halostagnicola kamekurae]SFS64113.1 Translation initiation factor 2B subunit, eIF-2B alpha/beta/delta family [Halostagnicola kamekurae]